jgi:GTP-binding protein
MNVVAIVGRPNVGKSTLFNRLIRRKNAIIDDTPGVTRDRIYGETDWNGKFFTLIDTGGFIPGTENVMEKSVREQAQIAIEEADVILFVCDGRDGVTPFDQDIAVILRNSDKPIVLVVNKCDNEKQIVQSYEFHALGVGEPFPVSALNGSGTGDFLDVVAEHLSEKEKEEEDPRLKIAFVGRPNVGKSSLTNNLLGQDRTIVTNIPGTTRDAIDSVLKYYGEEVVLIDTAGLRKRRQVKENIEMYSILRTARAIDRCDIAVVVLDATLGLEDQDKKIINQVNEARKGILLVVNKWDLVEKDSKTADKYTKAIHSLIKTFDYIPVIYVSAVAGTRVPKIIKLAQEIHERRKTKISTSKLNKTLMEDFDRTPPPSVRGKDLRINYITQIGIEPPKFAFFCNNPKLIPDSYKRFMERRIRDHFDFTGTPISFIFKRKNISWEEREYNRNNPR